MKHGVEPDTTGNQRLPSM